MYRAVVYLYNLSINFLTHIHITFFYARIGYNNKNKMKRSRKYTTDIIKQMKINILETFPVSSTPSHLVDI